MNKIVKPLKVLLIAVVTLTSLGATDAMVSAAEEFDINSKITYGEDNKNAVISLDIESINEEYTVETIKDPDGNEMDLKNLNHNVLSNGTYNFYVSYFDDTNTKSEYIKTVAVDGVKAIDRSGLTRLSADYSSEVEVLDWNILNDSGVPLSETNKAITYKTYQYEVKWELVPSGGEVLHEGDTFTLAFPKNETWGNWLISNSSWEKFYDSNNIELGEWRIYSNKIEVKLGVNVENKQSISGEFTSGTNAIQNGCFVSCIQNVSVGTVIKEIGFEGYNLKAMVPKDQKAASLGSNSKLQWYIYVNDLGAQQLSNNSLFTIQKNTYVEDTLTGKLLNFNISTHLYYPVDLISGEASSRGAAFTMNSFFSKVDPYPSETYEMFKDRLNPLEWGVYEDENGIQTVVANLGDIGDNGLKYSDIDSEFAKKAASKAIEEGFYQESDRAALEQYFINVYGDSNAIGGDFASCIVAISTEHSKVIHDSQVANTAILTKNGGKVQLSAIGTLQGVSGAARTVDANKARVWLSDKDTNEILDGVLLKLQRYNGSNWIDYSGWTGDVIGSNGYVDTSTLGYGTYRFVQQDAYSSEYDLENSDGYNLGLGKVISSEFTIAAGDTEGKTVYMTNVKYKYDVIYDPGAQGTFTMITNNDVVINSLTPAYDGMTGSDGNPAGNEGYTFTGWSPLVSSTVTADATYVAQWSANIDTAYKVEHYLEQQDGTFVLKDTENLAGTTDTTVSAVAKTYPGYMVDLLHTNSVLSGMVLGDGSLTLKLYYRANTNTGYKVEHYLEQLDGSYVLKDTESLTGTTGHTVSAITKTYAGYTFDNTVVGTIESGIVKGDGSLVLKLYYTLDDAEYKVEHYLEQGDGSFSLESSDSYNASIGSNVSATPKTYTTHIFDDTHPSTLTNGVVDGSLVLKLYYTIDKKPDIALEASYKVEHYLQKSDGTYTLQETETLKDTVGVNVTAIEKAYKGYKFDNTITGTVESGKVLGDNSLVLKLYYKKSGSLTVTMKPSVSPEENASNSSVSAGDTTNISAYMITVLAMVGVVIVLRRKKNRV